MKKFLELMLVYGIGIACVFTLAWRVKSVDNNPSYSLASNYNYESNVNNN